MNSEQAREVLLVEDNPGDILLTQQALKNAKIPTRLAITRDGEEAMRYLRRESEYTGAMPPCMILLDLNLPRMDGREVLAEIKKDSALREIPVVVLTSSEADGDLIEAYNLYANCYVVKPVEFEKFMEAVQAINSFWLDVAKLPPTRTFQA